MTAVTFDTTRLTDRRAMVETQCRARGIRDERTLNALVEIPRELFVPANQQPEAYTDRALPIDFGQTISQPYIVALMTETLRIEPHHVVLEIGTGSGYQSAILARLARHVCTVERLPDLSAAAAARLAALDLRNVTYHVGDGSAGWPRYTPYDRIIVTAGAPRVASALVRQLTMGGRLVAPIGDEESQTLVSVDLTPDGPVETPMIACRFVKLIGRDAWPAE